MSCVGHMQGSFKVLAKEIKYNNTHSLFIFSESSPTAIQISITLKSFLFQIPKIFYITWEYMTVDKTFKKIIFLFLQIFFCSFHFRVLMSLFMVSVLIKQEKNRKFRGILVLYG